MKNSVFFKFIAIALCAVSLLGMAGGGLGILALSECDLYNRTVDELIDERINDSGARIANNLALRYASVQLGGCSERLAYDQFPDYGGFLNVYGYALKDAEGTVLDNRDWVSPETGKTYSFPVSGQYMHLVNLLSRAEKYPAHQPKPSAYEYSDGEAYLYSAIPSEGIVIDEVVFVVAENGQYFEYSDPSGLGTAHYDQNGNVVFLITSMHNAFPIHSALYEIYLYDATGTLVYQAGHPESVGNFSYNEQDHSILFTALLSPEPQATEPVTEPTEVTEETVVETTVETVPETTAETVPETTVPEIEFHLEDNLPEEKSAEVTRLKATFLDGSIYEHKDAEGIGRVQHEDGIVTFSSYDKLGDLAEAAVVTRIRFWNHEDDLLLEAESPEGVGELYLTDSARLAYRSDFPAAAAEETQPEETTVEETVAETTAETTAETVSETVSETTVTEQTVEESLSAAETEFTTPAAILEEPEPTEPILIDGRSLDEFQLENTTYYDYDTDQEMYAEYVYRPLPEYTVELYIGEDSLAYQESYTILRIVRQFRDYLLPVLGISVLLFLISAVYLCCSAGRKPKSDEVRAGGLNRIPLDLYLCLAGFGITGLVIGAVEGGDYLMRRDLIVGCAGALGMALAACVLAVGFLFAMVAQIKTPGGFWWRNSLCGLCFQWFLWFMGWLEKYLRSSFFPFCGRLIKKLWKLTCALCVWTYRTTEKVLLWTGHFLGRIFRKVGSTLHKFLSLLPLTWQWLLVGFCLIIILIIGIDGFKDGSDLALPIALLLSFATVLYVAHCFGSLYDSAKHMSSGDLDTKVDDKLMVGCFRDFAGDLNALADVAVVAAQKQLKSERMKTELITNVSHDIKTPLTSIINYVDLLQKPHTKEEELQYLEVLDRQSLRLKKLIEDLMDMSKASTGNMAVEITQVDAVEAVNQALGEFADKLDRAQLIPMFRHTESSVPMMADGRLVWRVMSNLLSNAVKYALPSTRLYIDLSRMDGKVVISLKNISREELNMGAEELMERFVRGDDSRNTEGSGLGLNIAKSLMELQKGNLQLLVDGDLFKVTLIFPEA